MKANAPDAAKPFAQTEKMTSWSATAGKPVPFAEKK
jgi:hypothetical protein